MNKIIRRAIRLFFAITVALSLASGEEVERATLIGQPVTLNPEFYFANFGSAFKAAQTADHGNLNEQVVVQFYDFFSSQKYAVAGVDQKEIEFDLIALAARLADNYRKSHADDLASLWTERAQTRIGKLFPKLKAPEDSVNRLNDAVLKILKACENKTTKAAGADEVLVRKLDPKSNPTAPLSRQALSVEMDFYSKTEALAANVSRAFMSGGEKDQDAIDFYEAFSSGKYSVVALPDDVLAHDLMLISAQLAVGYEKQHSQTSQSTWQERARKQLLVFSPALGQVPVKEMDRAIANLLKENERK